MANRMNRRRQINMWALSPTVQTIATEGIGMSSGDKKRWREYPNRFDDGDPITRDKPEEKTEESGEITAAYYKTNKDYNKPSWTARQFDKTDHPIRWRVRHVLLLALILAAILVVAALSGDAPNPWY